VPLHDTVLARFQAGEAAVQHPAFADFLEEAPSIKWTPDLSWSKVQLLFAKHQLLHLRGALKPLADPRARLAGICRAFPDAVSSNWNIEKGDASLTWQQTLVDDGKSAGAGSSSSSGRRAPARRRASAGAGTPTLARATSRGTAALWSTATSTRNCWQPWTMPWARRLRRCSRPVLLSTRAISGLLRFKPAP
jgi:hypothetical protein